jgi:hypothetical protein
MGVARNFLSSDPQRHTHSRARVFLNDIIMSCRAAKRQALVEVNLKVDKDAIQAEGSIDCLCHVSDRAGSRDIDSPRG